MIVYIREPLTIKIDPESFDDSILKKFTVLFDRIDDEHIEIKYQKCTLNEYSVNELFDTFLSGFAIEYGYSGVGCDFSISVYSRPE